MSEKRTREEGGSAVEFHEPVEAPSQGLFFGGMWAVLLVGTLMVRTEWAEFHGSLLIALGALVLVCRPAAKVPKTWWMLAGVFIVAGAAAFLPADWFYYPEWRKNFDRLGIVTGSQVVIQAKQAAEQYAVFVVTLLVGIWMTGFRANGFQLRLWSLAFTVGVAGYAIASKILLDRAVTGPLIGDEHYGFFTNRNHTATYLVMGGLCGLGGVVQSIRDRRFHWLALFIVPTTVCLWAVVGLSISRAGPVLFLVGVMGWLAVIGFRYVGWKGLGWGALAASAAIGLFLAKPSKVRDRILNAATFSQTPSTDSKPADGEDVMAKIRKVDFRVPIALDTLAMIADFPWTGIGAGQFVHVFPQYRHWASVENDLFNKHPDNDWLWLASEAGLPALGAVGCIVILAAWKGWRSVRRGRERALRGACLVAAGVVPFHGLMDVPGHQVTLALSSCWLFAMALSDGGVGGNGNWSFKIKALVILGVGWSFLNGGWWGHGRPLIQSSSLEVARAKEASLASMAKREEAHRLGVKYRTEDAGDPIVASIQSLEKERVYAPLDRNLIRYQAFLACNFRNQSALIDRNFAWERALEPSWIAIPIWHAEVWSNLDPSRCDQLIADALDRAQRLDGIQEGSRFSRQATLSKIRELLSYKPKFRQAVSQEFLK